MYTYTKQRNNYNFEKVYWLLDDAGEHINWNKWKKNLDKYTWLKSLTVIYLKEIILSKWQCTDFIMYSAKCS